MEVDLDNTCDIFMMMMTIMMMLMIMAITVTKSIFKLGPPDFAHK